MTRETLAQLGIRNPENLSAWAKARGLLGVYIRYRTAAGFLPACWQVVRPGHNTDDTGPVWQGGHKTFICRDVEEKSRVEEIAKTWASGKFGVRQWVRIEGLGNCLFPQSLSQELARHIPINARKKRQHT